MLLPIVFALAVPASFVHAVEARSAAEHLHVVDWWADDLDGDHVPESIAFVCGDDAGLFLVQRGAELLETAREIDGRNNCPDAPAARPAWRIEKSGTIDEAINVHHGTIGYSFAIRGGQLVLVREDSSGFDVGRDGNTDEEDHVDYDNLTWSQRITPPHGHAKQTSGPLVLITDQVRRASNLIGKTTLAATTGENTTTLHLHADRALVVRDCNDTPCKSTRLAAGDRELTVSATSELEVVAGKTKIHVHLRALEGKASFPPPPGKL